MKVLNFLRCVGCTAVAVGLMAGNASAQIKIAIDAAAPAPAVLTPATTAVKTEVKKADDKKDAKAEEPAKPAKPKADPEVIRLDLMDGSGVSGKLSIKDITVETRFGTLKVPVTEIKSFTPGLDSYPQLNDQVKNLIEKLGADEFNDRKSAQDELTKMGAGVRGELQKYVKDENAERARRVQAILEALEGESGDEEAPSKSTWVHQDTVETADFTVTGHISPKSFELASKFGTLTVALADIRKARRDTETKDETRKTVMVDQTSIAYANKALKNSGVKVEKGDKITLVADGTLTMSPWGNESLSTPEGDQNNYGVCSYGGQSLPGGSLFGRVGDSGTVFKIGSKNTFTADRAGTLQFGIAMQPNYARGNYQFPGGYNVKIRVEPK